MRSVGAAGAGTDPATFFAAVIASGTGHACGCSVTPLTPVPATFLYQTTSPATNQLVGTPNTPVDIPGGGLQTFLLAFAPTPPFPATDVRLSFTCANTPAAAIQPFLNTAVVAAETVPVPDIVALAATPSGDGIVDVPGATGAAAFAVATVNVGGASGRLTVSASTTGPLAAAVAGPGEAVLPVALSVCETNPATSVCAEPPAATVVTDVDPGQTPTFAVFVQAAGVVPFDPAGSRVFVRFTQGGVLRGATSVAVRTQ
jgi:hypothetical protein